MNTYVVSEEPYVKEDAPDVLAERRRVLGLAREKVAAQAGVSGMTLYNLETRRVAPQLGTVLALALALGLTAQDVFTDKTCLRLQAFAEASQ